MPSGGEGEHGRDVGLVDRVDFAEEGLAAGR
jgi:hypothetical protein